jgi:hypothetical protein
LPFTPPYKEAQEKGVFSYGNRLFCDWKKLSNEKEQARFRWGSAITYSQFFEDYQRFLFRPAEICQAAPINLSKEKLFVVKLDLSKFYDRIDRDKLIEEIEEIVKDYSIGFEAHVPDQVILDDFYELLGDIMGWKWSNSAKLANESLEDVGLPQGLVASGFFANAYMHRFDQEMGKLIGKTLKEDGLQFRLLDYCRYVDDLCVVVAVKKSIKATQVESIVSTRISKKLNRHCKKQELKLELNKEKTEAIAWEDFVGLGSTSRFMRGVQKQISQAPDPVTLANATGNLDHLLWLADSVDGETSAGTNILELAHIEKPKADVRDDTIQRFAANRLRTVLRLRRSMADPLKKDESGSSNSVSERESLDHEIENIARKLIACFAKNPALTGVLRCGLDLKPSPDLLLPVLDALEAKLSNGSTDFADQERMVALYVLSDLFKAGAVETGFARGESYPASSDIDGYRSELIRIALELVNQDDLPWFVHQQALLYLASMRYPVQKKNGELLKEYRALHRALRLEKPRFKRFSSDFCAGLIVLQMTGDYSNFETWLYNWLNREDASKAVEMVDSIALLAPGILSAVCRKWKKNPRKMWYRHALETYIAPFKPISRLKSLVNWDGQVRPLAAIVSHPENPFVQENALLKLAETLVESYLQDKIPLDDDLTLCNLEVGSDNWGAIQTPGGNLSVFYEEDDRTLPCYETPTWCQEDTEWAYHLGRILRSSIIGKEDFTLRYYPEKDVLGAGYRKLENSWYKRRVGLMPVSAGLGEEVTPIPPWMNELILSLLQWPGLEISGEHSKEFKKIKTPAELLGVLRKRKDELAGYFGTLSNLPVCLLPAYEDDERDLSHFKVAIVQTLMPRMKDFCTHNPTYWKPEYRPQHRAHLASMCRLLAQQMASNQIASSISDSRTHLDLIVFPELSVHQDDMWLLSRLSDLTKATIFAGQTYIDHPYLGQPINRAVWLLRQKGRSGRSLIQAFQGKKHITGEEEHMGIAGHRPFQIVVNFKDKKGKKANLSGIICYDSTDLKLAADLREVTDGMLIAALNKDINTFDTMVQSLQYHMFQPVVLSNTGEFGGSTAQAPYKEKYDRLISHIHGANQAMVSIFEIDLLAFKDHRNPKAPKEKKTAPAGYKGRRL